MSVVKDTFKLKCLSQQISHQNISSWCEQTFSMRNSGAVKATSDGEKHLGHCKGPNTLQ